ncbi:MAG: divalent-cation tolerance protein CutA [Persephonella sp.]|nr:MAG: divalent-cation tolerance protein CutA [Persephonella sp.]
MKEVFSLEYKYIVIFITVPSLEVGKNIADLIVEKKLGACVNISSKINSVYFWDGNIERDDEYLLIIKSRKDKFKELEEEVKKVHPYTVPEIIAMPIILGSDDYLNWIDETLDR